MNEERKGRLRLGRQQKAERFAIQTSDRPPCTHPQSPLILPVLYSGTESVTRMIKHLRKEGERDRCAFTHSFPATAHFHIDITVQIHRVRQSEWGRERERDTTLLYKTAMQHVFCLEHVCFICPFINLDLFQFLCHNVSYFFSSPDRK